MQQGPEVFFLLMGAILVFAMHGGFALLERVRFATRTKSTRL